MAQSYKEPWLCHSISSFHYCNDPLIQHLCNKLHCAWLWPKSITGWAGCASWHKKVIKLSWKSREDFWFPILGDRMHPLPDCECFCSNLPQVGTVHPKPGRFRSMGDVDGLGQTDKCRSVLVMGTVWNPHSMSVSSCRRRCAFPSVQVVMLTEGCLLTPAPQNAA